MFAFDLKQVARRFQLGFYAGWEKGVAEFLGGDSNTTGVSERISDLGSEGIHSDVTFNV